MKLRLGFIFLLFSFATLFAEEKIKLHKYTTLIVEQNMYYTAVSISNKGLFPVTVTIDPGRLLKTLNDISLPYIGTIKAKEILSFKMLGKYPLSQILKWTYLKTGSIEAKHNDDYIYLYPFQSDEKISISQYYNGDFSHQGEYKYAIDWKMPEGTKIVAAREGMVVDFEQSFVDNGLTNDYRSKANFILILHDDGTIAEYLHLKHNGVLCKIGQHVKRGELIGLSGNTGYSTGPHLHFCVHRTESGTIRHSIKVKFNNIK